MKAEQLAKDVLTQTLHGPVPIETVAKLAQGVLDREADLARVTAEQDRLRVAAEKLHAFVNSKGQEHEERALGRTSTQSKTYDEERALVCWQVLDEIEALFQGAGDEWSSSGGGDGAPERGEDKGES